MNPSQLREQLQKKAILELLGPAGGDEEIRGEASADCESALQRSFFSIVLFRQPPSKKSAFSLIRNPAGFTPTL